MADEVKQQATEEQPQELECCELYGEFCYPCQKEEGREPYHE